MNYFFNSITLSGLNRGVITAENNIAEAKSSAHQQLDQSQQEFVVNHFSEASQNTPSIYPSLTEKNPEPVILSKPGENDSCFQPFYYFFSCRSEGSVTKENNGNETVELESKATTDSSESSKTAKSTAESPEKPETLKREEINIEISKEMIDSPIEPKTLEIEPLEATQEIINKMQVHAGYVRKEIKESEQKFLNNLNMSFERLEGLVLLKRNEERSFLSRMMSSGDLTTIKQKLIYKSGLHFLPATDTQIYELKKTINAISIYDLLKIRDDYLEACKVVSQMNDAFINAETNLEFANAYMENIENYFAVLQKCVLDFTNEKFQNSDKGGAILYGTAFQRLPRHVLLLKDLIKNSSSEDKQSLTKALESVEAKSKEINALLT